MKTDDRRELLCAIKNTKKYFLKWLRSEGEKESHTSRNIDWLQSRIYFYDRAHTYIILSSKFNIRLRIPFFFLSLKWWWWWRCYWVCDRKFWQLKCVHENKQKKLKENSESFFRCQISQVDGDCVYASKFDCAIGAESFFTWLCTTSAEEDGKNVALEWNKKLHVWQQHPMWQGILKVNCGKLFCEDFVWKFVN